MSCIQRKYLTWLAIVSTVVILASVRVEERVRLVVEGGLQFEPATVRLRVWVQPDPENRGLSMGVDSGSFATSSWEDLEGEQSAPTRWTAYYRDLPAGEYVAYADVIRPASENWHARTTFRVLSRY